MIIKILKTLWGFALLLVTAACFFSCMRNKNPDVSAIEANVSLRHFEKDLFGSKDLLTLDDINDLRKKYPGFFDLYCHRMIRLPEMGDSVLLLQLNDFIEDKDVRAIYAKTDSVFSEKDYENLEDALTEFAKHLKYYFVAKPVPQFITYISAFNYNIVATDSALAIGLDKYLGSDCPFYPSLDYPQYMYRKFSKEYIVNDCIKGWYESEYDPEVVKKELLSQMIYYGRLMYFTQMMAPTVNDTIVTGYTSEQLRWCRQNESNIWAFFIERNLLYETSEKEIMKYIGEGGTTQGMPKESPGQTGCYIGWQIVKAYMRNNEIPLIKLLDETDAQKILDASGYKPGK